MEFQDVVHRRRMVRSYNVSRRVPPGVIDRIVANGLRAPSAGFSQGWAFLVLDTPAEVGRFRAAVRPADHPEDWFAANVDAPALIIPHSNKGAYLDRYAQPDKGFTDRSDAWWPAPYWDIDTGFASLLMLLTAVDAGLGACFFGIPIEQIDPYRAAFGIPTDFTPIGAISIGYSDESPRDFSDRRKPMAETVHRGRWNQPGMPAEVQLLPPTTKGRALLPPGEWLGRRVAPAAHFLITWWRQSQPDSGTECRTRCLQDQPS